MTKDHNMINKYKLATGKLRIKPQLLDTCNQYIDSTPNLSSYSNTILPSLQTDTTTINIEYPIICKKSIDVHDKMRINICLHNINSQYHYLTYLLYNINNIWSFPYFIYDINQNMNVQINSLLSQIYKDINVKIIFKGYLICNNQCYIICNTTHVLSVKDTSYQNLYINMTLCEILNYKECLLQYIDTNIINLFISNKSLIYLYTNGSMFDIPYVKQTEIYDDCFKALANNMDKQIVNDYNIACKCIKRELIIDGIPNLLSIHHID